MYNFCITLKKRLKDFLMGKAKLTAPYTANSSPASVVIDDSTIFNIVWANKNWPQALIFPDVTKPNEFYRVKIKAVDKSTETITFADPIPANLPVGTVIKRAPAYKEIQTVVLGDWTVLPAYPAICIEPTSKNTEWQTLITTKETVTFNIYVHVLAENNENAVLQSTRITEDVLDLLNADLHIKLEEMDKSDHYNRPYNSLAKDVNYGFSNKGAFLRSSMITWSADTHWLRMIAAQHPEVDDFQ